MKLTAEVKAAFARMGKRGGKVRASRLTEDERKAAAKHAADSRWEAVRDKARAERAS